MPEHKNLYGITESNKVAGIIGTAIVSISNIDSNQDDKISTLEVLNAIQVNAFKVISNAPNLTELRNEVTDYTEEEKESLVANLTEEVQMGKLKTKALFDRGVGIVLDVIDFIIDTRKADEDFEPIAA